MIHKLQDNVHEHEAYNENFSECAEWVNTLARRLQVCADMAGDKHDVEDRLAKLQVLQLLNTKHLCNCLLYQNNITFSSNTSLIIVYQIYKWKKNCECLPFHALLLKHLNILDSIIRLFALYAHPVQKCVNLLSLITVHSVRYCTVWDMLAPMQGQCTICL